MFYNYIKYHTNTNKKRGNSMSDSAKEWIDTALKVSGETKVTREVLMGAIEMVESSLVEFGEVEDLVALDELEGMLHDSE